MAQQLESQAESAEFDEVYSREIDAINERRDFLHRPQIKLPIRLNVARAIRTMFSAFRNLFGGNKKFNVDPIYRKSVDAGLVGLALSGGGVRSASFCMGAVQALEADHAIDRIDLLSTVSGGGYTGVSITSAMTTSEGRFPFPSTLDSEEPLPLKHIRDYSNYLIPDGSADLLASGAIYLRGIVINCFVMLPWLLILAAFTVFFNPDRNSLDTPGPIGSRVIVARDFVLHSVDAFIGPGGWFPVTLVLLGIVLILLIIGGFNIFSRWEPQVFAETGGFWTTLIGRVFLATAIVGACELQVFLLGLKFDPTGSYGELAVKYVNYLLLTVVPAGTLLSFFARTFEAWIVKERKDARFARRLRAALAQLAVLIGAAVVPLLLWSVYFYLSYWGIAGNDGGVAATWLYNHANSFFGPYSFISWLFVPTNPVWLLYLLIAVTLLILSHLLDPNRNSLHRLYRDRLSKAFIYYFPPADTEPKPGLAASGVTPMDEGSVAKKQDGVTKILDGVTKSADDPATNKDAADKRAAEAIAGGEIDDLVTTVSAAAAGRSGDGSLLPNDKLKLSTLSTRFAPYHLINAALNIQNSKYVNRRGRNADFFFFSPKYVGSAATRYVKTKDIEDVHSELDVATAMAISGAAISSNMGSNTIRPLTPTLTVLNIRLGFWLRNPKWRELRMTAFKRLFDFLRLYFFAEMFGRLRETSWRVFLTDGGHVENLGIYELLRRECKLIVAVDAEADAEMNFGSFVKLERYARIDLGVIIDLPWRRLRAVTLDTARIIGKSGEPRKIETRKGPHCVIGRIQYPKGEGYLVYVKSSMSGDENDYIQDYKRRHADFPHETTGDQFFTEEQFEVYRALGFHAMSGLLSSRDEMPACWDRMAETGETPPLFARPSDPKSQQAYADIRVLLGLPPFAPASAPPSAGSPAQPAAPAKPAGRGKREKAKGAVKATKPTRARS